MWEYNNGQIINAHSGLCLDATNMANGTQLIMNDCNGGTSQNWYLK